MRLLFTFCERLRAALDAARVKPDRLCDAANLPLERLQLLCAGKATPSEEELIRIAFSIDCSPTWLTHGTSSLAGRRLHEELHAIAEAGRTRSGRVVVESDDFISVCAAGIGRWPESATDRHWDRITI